MLWAPRYLYFAAAVSWLSCAPLALAQSTTCESGWIPSFQDIPFAPATSPFAEDLPTGRAFAEFDDGSGNALYFAAEVASGSAAQTQILRYSENGSTVIGADFDGTVSDLCAYDDGTGEALYVAFSSDGAFSFVSPLKRWDGTTWTDVALPAVLIDGVEALETWDDGSGPKLYAGFDTTFAFNDFGGIAAYDGQGWSPLDGGLNGKVLSIEVFDDGTQQVLAVGGIFSQPSGAAAPVQTVAAFDGTGWQPFGSGIVGMIESLETHDDGQGPALFAGGSATDPVTGETNRLHRWNGTTWAPVPGVAEPVRALLSIPAGSELTAGLYMAADNQDFSSPEQACVSLGRWDGSAWNPVGTGIPGSFVQDLIAFDDGQATSLFAAYRLGGVDSGDRGLGRFGCGAAPRHVSVSGCGALKPSLLPTTGSLDLGTTTRLTLFGNFGANASSWFYYLGQDGSDASGCGLELPGLGELLLDPGAPIQYLGVNFGNPAFFIQPSLQVPIPADATLAGKSIAVQAIGPNVGGQGLVRFSRSLVATLEFAP